nr:NADH dehydrogenase subunit 6 [Lophiomys imhausi]
MNNLIIAMSVLLVVCCLGLALKPSPIYGGVCLIVGGCAGCVMVLGLGGSFLGLLVFLIYLGGMMVVFGYTTAMATEEYPEVWGLGLVGYMSVVAGIFVESYIMCVVDKSVVLDLGVEICVIDNWAAFEIYDFGVVVEGGSGVAVLYNCAVWLMLVAGWSLFAGIFVIIEIIRGD